ncbi:hypothetical protein K469DRAFT_95000 [Zopfia rhizophila CBS 207.26]|uniref:Uncharacterized protein n=1 Tax=Zopfia rhizophila CBS 207.26 TaxID=1314779 RepID=A0A6A6ECU5_9PEZI|nr:hypothetical protein K469DRAFT_95000 [Zopfia rhizophila CBS 207.26]
MPLGSVCCDDGSSTYCPIGDYCDTNGCCPLGKFCNGPGGTMTFDTLTGTGSFPTRSSIATGHSGNNAVHTSAGNAASPQSTGAASAGFGFGHVPELSALLLLAGQLVLG